MQSSPRSSRPSSRSVRPLGFFPLSLVVALSPAVHAESPFASNVVSYTAGIGAAAGYTNPSVALGSPERFTGEGFLPQAVTAFQPAFVNNEVVSIGMGGSLILSFDHDVLDDPRNPFGIDLLVFGNSFCSDVAAPNGVVGTMFAEGGTIALSLDGIEWAPVLGIAADGPFPTIGYTDVGPYATAPGRALTDFTRPVDPSLLPDGLVGRSWEEMLDAYQGSGGGAGVDIGSVGLSAVRYVRITGPVSFGISPEIDAVADVAPSATISDLDLDGSVGASDLAILLGAWGTDGPGDLDGNGVVEAGDLAILLGSWS